MADQFDKFTEQVKRVLIRSQQEVLRADVGVVEVLGLLLGPDQHPLCLLGEFVELVGHSRPSSGGVTRGAAAAQPHAGRPWRGAGPRTGAPRPDRVSVPPNPLPLALPLRSPERTRAPAIRLHRGPS